MRWKDVCSDYLNQWLVIEAVQAHSEGENRLLDKIAVVEVCPDGAASMRSYRTLHQLYPEREYYYAHTSRSELDIRERQWLGIREIVHH
jgi:hypothetical protein